MKFAHIADVHIGAWRDPKLNEVTTKAFEKAIDMSIEENVDFVIIAGDLFNTPLPAIDKLKSVVIKLKELKDKKIPVYGIPGSHDFSPSGKTMIDVLESAGLFTNVCKGEIVDGKLKLKFTEDKTGVKLTGMIGKKGMLDKKYYENLDLSISEEPGKKIFIFHTMVTELKPKHLEKMDSQEVTFLPNNFDYYAGGHPHIVKEGRFENRLMVYPGPIFPNSFSELEKLHNGGFYIIEDFNPRFVPIKFFDTIHLNIDADHKTPEEVENLIRIEDVKGKIITIRISGTLESGKKSDIDFNKIFSDMYQRGAYFIMKNTVKLNTKEFEEVKVDLGAEDIEDKIIKEHLGKMNVPGMDEEKTIKELIKILSNPKLEGEKVADFQTRILNELSTITK